MYNCSLLEETRNVELCHITMSFSNVHLTSLKEKEVNGTVLFLSALTSYFPRLLVFTLIAVHIRRQATHLTMSQFNVLHLFTLRARRISAMDIIKPIIDGRLLNALLYMTSLSFRHKSPYLFHNLLHPK